MLMAIAFVSGYIPWILVRPPSHLQITAKAAFFLVVLPKPSLADVVHALVPPAPVLIAGFSESTIPAHGPGFPLWWIFCVALNECLCFTTRLGGCLDSASGQGGCPSLRFSRLLFPLVSVMGVEQVAGRGAVACAGRGFISRLVFRQDGASVGTCHRPGCRDPQRSTWTTDLSAHARLPWCCLVFRVGCTC